MPILPNISAGGSGILERLITLNTLLLTFVMGNHSLISRRELIMPKTSIKKDFGVAFCCFVFEDLKAAVSSCSLWGPGHP